MYIYQELDGNECIRQMFRIVNPNDKDYQEIVQYNLRIYNRLLLNIL